MKTAWRARVLPLVAVGLAASGVLSGATGHLAGSPQPAPAQKLALLVGVNKYRDPGIPPLSGCANDVANWDDVLRKQFGFAAQDIHKLVDGRATKAAVKEAFAKHLLARATPGSVVVIAIASHGTQVLDQNGDEKTDGLDEAFVLHDSAMKADGGGPPSQLIDDELNELITQLNRKTPHVVLIADACFSGTITRAAGSVRAVPASDRDRALAEERVAQSRMAAGEGAESLKPAEGGPRYVLISAARSTEAAHEKSFGGQPSGAFSWFLTAALRQTAGETSYKDVFEKMRYEVTTAFPSQHPELEGAEQDTAVFGVKRLAAEPYLAVEAVQGRTVTLAGGQAHGVGVGSRFVILPPGAKSPSGAAPLATAEVKAVTVTTAQAQLAEDIRLPAGARAFPSAYMVPLQRTKVFIPRAPALLAKIRRTVAENPAVEVVDEPKGYDLRVFQDPARRALVLEGGSAEPIADPIPEGSADAAGALVARIGAWARWYNVRNLKNPSQALAVSFKLVKPAERAAKSKAADGNLTRLVVGESFDLRIENGENRPLYFSLLDLSSTGEITVAYPQPGAEAVVEAKGSWQRRFKATLRKGVDYDRDTAKLIVSTRPLDLRFVEQGGTSRGGGGVRSLVADLVGRAAQGGAGTRSFVQDSEVADQWTTRELVFEVQPEVTTEEQSLIDTCHGALSSLGVRWKKTSPMRGVVDPVELDPQIGGVTFRDRKGRASRLYLSCLFAEQVARFARAIASVGVTDVYHLGIYNYRCIGGGSPDGRACKVSQHAYGRAIDLHSFKTAGGTFVVKDDWTKRPPPTCSATGGTAKDRFLRDLACKASRAAGFNVLLTPNYNAAHRDHFHADATPGGNFVRGGRTNPPETDPADPDLGD